MPPGPPPAAGCRCARSSRAPRRPGADARTPATTTPTPTTPAEPALVLFEEVVAPAEAGGDAHDVGQLPARRRVGGEEPGGAGEDERALLRPRGPALELGHRGLDRLVPVKGGVLA